MLRWMGGRLVISIVVGSTALASSARPARACIAAQCAPDHVAPAGASMFVPANLPALVYRPGTTRAVDTVPNLELRTSAGATVETTIEKTVDPSPELLVRPRAPLTPGSSYVLRYPEYCPAGTARFEAPVAREHPFTAVASAPLPATLGTVVSTTRVGAVAINAMGSCTRELRAAVVDLAITPSPALQPYLPLTRFSTYVDDRLWATSEVGSLAPPSGGQRFLDQGTRRVDRIHAACSEPPSDDFWNATGIARGRHRVEVRAHVAGAAVDPPSVTIDVVMTCEETAAAAGCACVVPRARAGSEGTTVGGAIALGAVLACSRRRRGGRAARSSTAMR